MYNYDKRDIFTHDDYLKTAAELSKNNEYITETAGFVPLEVKLKQFEQNGVIAQFQTSDFTSNDYREMYLNPDFDITPEDDLEDVEEKIAARNAFIEKYKSEKQKTDAKASVSAESAEKQTKEEVQRTEEKV